MQTDVVETQDTSASDTIEAERKARIANSPDLWNKLWQEEGQETWRKHALSQVYTRIERIIPQGTKLVDLGGGVGILGARLRDSRNAEVLVVDHSPAALEQAAQLGLETAIADLESDEDLDRVLGLAGNDKIVVATEVVEHLSAETRHKIFRHAAKRGKALFSVPNDRLGPDEEPQHTVKYNAMSFKADLKQHFEHVRIEVLGPYLLGVCGWEKNFTLSVCLPVRDEAEDLEATLASFRSVADEIVVGVDHRTSDATREVARKYAEVVFDITDPEGPEDDRAPNGGVHFAHVRNRCMERCTGEWIFMTEGHERLVSGWEALMNLDQLPKAAKVGFVLRTGTGQQWAFPWLCRNDPKIRYARKTHNILDYPTGTYCIQLPQVRTLHERVKDREEARAKQRKVQNRITLLDDWMANQNENSLHYLGAEWREHNPVKAIERLEEFMALPKKNGPMRYHTRLVLAKMYATRQEYQKAREVLLGAAGDDWSRTEHWLWLGDLAWEEDKYEEALQWYRYAATRVNDPPFTFWWVDLACYSYLPAQRLTQAHAMLGQFDDSLYWARRVLELLPDDAESWAFEEAQSIVTQLEEKVAHV